MVMNVTLNNCLQNFMLFKQ